VSVFFCVKGGFCGGVARFGCLLYFLEGFKMHVFNGKRRRVIGHFLALVMCLNLFGCSGLNTVGDASAVTDEPVANTLTLEVNQQLQSAQDVEGIERAITTVFEYAASRSYPVPSEGNEKDVSVATTKLSAVDFSRHLNVTNLAAREFQLRSEKKTGAVSLQSSDLTSVADAAEKIKQAGKEDVSEAYLKTIQAEVRAAIPNLAIDEDNKNMGPLESIIVTYVAITGDDGTAAPGSIPINQAVLESPAPIQRLTSARLQFLDWVVLAVFTYIVIDLDTQQSTDRDVFGNPVGEHQYRLFSVGYGRKEWRRTGTTNFYTMQHLFDASATMANDFHLYVAPGSDLAGILPSYSNVAGVGSPTVPSLPSSARVLSFPWENWKSQMKKGDIIFKKSSRDDVVTKFSFLTHACILSNTSNKGMVLESVYRGVDEYVLGENWLDAQGRPDDYYFAVKRLGGVSQSTIEKAVDSAKSKWAKTMRYIPQRTLGNRVDTIGFYRDWAFKYTMDSMYCSKLVWATYNGIRVEYGPYQGSYVDLDSDATQVTGTYAAVIGDRYDKNGSVSYSFIGVSPDDIFNSKYLDPYFKLEAKGY
jgi:hypothetical protein